MNKSKITHPLSGTNLSNLIQLLRKNDPVPPSSWPRLATVFLAVLARWPVTQVERVLTPLWIRQSPPMQPPLFIIGHWRSGTTHLGNILSKDPKLGYVSPIAAGIPWEMLTIGRLFKRQLEKKLPESRLIDNVPVRPNSPQEDEFGVSNMIPFSFLHSYYFSGNLKENLDKGVFWEGCTPEEIDQWRKAVVYFLRKVHIHQDHRRLVIRNPVYMGRLLEIQSLFPGARFIHIYRNPYRVFRSMQNFYQRLLPALSLQPYEMDKVEEVTLEVYDRLMQRYRTESAGLPPEVLMEVRFEDLEADPLPILEEVYGRLEIGDFEKARAPLEKYLGSVRRYKKNRFDKETASLTKVRDRWASHFDWLSYEQ